MTIKCIKKCLSLPSIREIKLLRDIGLFLSAWPTVESRNIPSSDGGCEETRFMGRDTVCLFIFESLI